MPLYEYRCCQCGEEFERIRSLAQADEPGPCPQCGGLDIARCLSVFASYSRSNGESRALGGGGGCASCSANSCAGCKG